MAIRLLKLTDGTLVEVSSDEADATGAFKPVVGGSAMQKAVSASLDSVTPLVKRIVLAWSNAYKELSTEIHVESAEVDLGISFETEGNVYIAKSKGTASVGLKLCFKPPRT